MQYEIIDSVSVGNNNFWYTVYAPDTNWNEMIGFAANLVKAKDDNSSVAYFNPKEKTPVFGDYYKQNENYGLPQESVDYIIANYRFSDSMHSFYLYKAAVNFKKR